MKHTLAWFVTGSIAALALACSSTAADGSGDDNTDGESTGGATTEAVDGCKRGCDKMKFFDCSSADELAACYGDCKSASSDQIEVFTSCAENSICDPQCRTSIVPKPSGTTGTPKGEGATPDSCTSACEKLASCSFIKVGDQDACVDVCKKEAYQFQIDCVNGNECSTLEKACGAGESTDEPVPGGGTSSGGGEVDDSFSIQRCKNACETSKFYDCTDAAGLTACSAACDDAETAKRDTYSTCVDASGSECTELEDCYSRL